jgi:hypothetical protein
MAACHRVGILVGRNAQADTARRVESIELNGFFDLAGIKPTDLCSFLQGIRFSPLLEELEAGLALFAVDDEGAFESRREVVVPGIGYGLRRIGLGIPHHIGVRSPSA